LEYSQINIGFTVQVNLPEAAVQQALSGDFGEQARQVIAAAHPYPEGRWLFMPVETERDLADIRKLITMRVAWRGLSIAS
jgi:hypothetical protein